MNAALKNYATLPNASNAYTFLIASLFLFTNWVMSPLPEMLLKPSSYTQDSYFQLDYRIDENPIRPYQHKFATSPFWASLSAEPISSVKIAIAPFNYATFAWPASVWEKASHQRVIPAYLWGACEKTRHGEVPNDNRFQFKNAVHLASQDQLGLNQVDYLVYYLGYQKGIGDIPGAGKLSFPDCEAWVRGKYGKPHYEDDVVLVWRLNSSKPLLK